MGYPAACVFGTASVIRGPFFQRALTIDNRTLQSRTGNMELRVAQFLPPNYFMIPSLIGVSTLTLEFRREVTDLTLGASHRLNYTRCGGECTMSIRVRSERDLFSNKLTRLNRVLGLASHTNPHRITLMSTKLIWPTWFDCSVVPRIMIMGAVLYSRSE